MDTLRKSISVLGYYELGTCNKVDSLNFGVVSDENVNSFKDYVLNRVSKSFFDEHEISIILYSSEENID